MVAASILLVSTDSGVIAGLRRTVSTVGYHLRVVGSLEEAEKVRTSESFDAILVQTDAPGVQIQQRLSGGFLFRRQPPVIALAKSGTIRDAVRCIQAGASDYLGGRPLSPFTLRNALRRASSGTSGGILESCVGSPDGNAFGGFVTADYRMRSVCETVATVAESKVTLLIVGESGTGKTLIAKMLHENSPRRLGPFVELNCGLLTDSLLESEIFGHARGAFTSAYRERRGKFELADGGTIFLDEIANASQALQVKLLRVVESGLFSRLGDTGTMHCDVRLVVATNTSLEEKVGLDLFREDLYHRLSAVKVDLPPLRDRVGDIPLLARHFLRMLSTQHRRGTRGFSPTALERLVHYRWPGNIRELRNAVEHGVIMAHHKMITPESLPQHIAAYSAPSQLQRPRPRLQPLKDAMREPERQVILHALRIAGWNKQHAAKKLGISRSTLYKKMKEHGLERVESEQESLLLGMAGVG